jgi:hypothetical protein
MLMTHQFACDGHVRGHVDDSRYREDCDGNSRCGDEWYVAWNILRVRGRGTLKSYSYILLKQNRIHENLPPSVTLVPPFFVCCLSGHLFLLPEKTYSTLQTPLYLSSEQVKG